MFKIQGDEKFVEWYENATDEERQHNALWKISLALILTSAIIFIGVRGQAETAPGAYEVRGVANGALQVVERATGAPTELKDQNLVKQALAGKIKRGDIIEY